MKPGIYNIVVYQGADFELPLVWRNPDESIIDLTGYTAALQGRRSKGSSDPFLDLSTPTEIVLSNTNPNIRIVMTAVETTALDFSQGVYDLELTDPSGKVTRLLEGEIELSKEVTR